MEGVRLINADELIKDIERDRQIAKQFFLGVDRAIDVMFDSVKDSILDAPTVDAVPIVHGHWDDSLDGITPYCSVCHRTHRGMNRTPDYCPNCGATMKNEVKT